MSGQTLMCVWQAVAATNPKASGGAPTSTVRSITTEIARPPTFKFSDSSFQKTFTSAVVDYQAYRLFMRTEVINKSSPLHLAEAEIERKCWDLCKASYKFGSRSHVTTDDLLKLWQMFNRICSPGTCPPVVLAADFNWFANKIAQPMSKTWSDLSLDSTPLTFLDSLKILNERVFSRDSLSDAQKSIEQLHAWLVREVSMTGWMFKRTRKQGNNWTTWQRRYCILLPGELRYYSSARASEKDYKGKMSILPHSRLESLPDYKSITRKYVNRFRLSNIPILEMELSTVTAHEKNAWMAAVGEVIEACTAGTTPVQAVLNDRLKRNKANGPKESIEQAMSRLKSVRLSKVPTKLIPQEEEDLYSASLKPSTGSAANAPIIEEQIASPQSSMEDEDDEEFDNDSYSFQKQKVKRLFDQIDKNGNGLLNEREFDEFIRVLVGRSRNEAGIPVSVAIFADIDEDGDLQINFDEFYSYFTKLVLDPSPATEAESLLKAEFIKADSEGNSAVDFGDFSDFVWERRRSFRYQSLMSAFDRMSGNLQADIQFPQLQEFVVGQCGPANDTIIRNKEFTSTELGRQIRDIQGDGDSYNVAKTLTEQWFDFVKEKGLVATDPQRIAQNYNLLDVVCFTKDSGRKPELLSVEAARWEAPLRPDMPADLILPADSSTNVPVMDADEEYLKYYGSRLADENQEQIATLYHHNVHDFGYANQGFGKIPGSLGGPGMERSSKCRFVSPMSRDSGHLILARWEGDEEILEITGFIIPANVSVYIPPGTMHSMDYVKGSWRTLVEDDAKVDFAFVKRQFRPDNDRDLENVIFTVNE